MENQEIENNEIIQALILDVVATIKKHPEWSSTEKIRFAYLEAGKHLTKNVAFFYSLGKKMLGSNYTEEQLSKIYNDNKIIKSRVICKSAALILKSIYDQVGIRSKLDYYDHEITPGSELGISFDIIHYYLECIGDNGDRLRLTLNADLPYIQNGWETEHFIRYFRGEEKASADARNMAIAEFNQELKRIDARVGYLKRKIPPVNTADEWDEKNFYDYEAGTSRRPTQKNGSSPYIYDRLIRGVASKKEYREFLLTGTEFFRSACRFKFKDGMNGERRFSDTPVSAMTTDDIADWCSYLWEQLSESLPDIDADLAENFAIDMEHRLSQARDLVVEAMTNQKQEREARKAVASVKTQLMQISSYFVEPEVLERGKTQKAISKYVLKRFESLFPFCMQLSSHTSLEEMHKWELQDLAEERGLKIPEECTRGELIVVIKADGYEPITNPPMTSRSEGIAEQLVMVDKLLEDLFEEDFDPRKKSNSQIVRTTVHNTDTDEYDIIFQVCRNYYYYMNPRTGEFHIVKDLFTIASQQNLIILDDDIRKKFDEVAAQEEKRKR